MKRFSKLFMALVLSVFFVGCFASNTDINPKKVLVREFKGLKIEVSRSDLSGVFIDVQNMTTEPVSILWGETTLGDSEIVRHDGIINTALNTEEVSLKSLERRTFVIHRKVDFYYLDPVLYAKGGIRIKPLKYPVELKLMTKFMDKKELVSIFVDNNYSSNENAKDDRYLEDKYEIEKRETKDIKDKDYKSNLINRRDKGDTLPEAKKIYPDSTPVEDNLIIEHRN